jgi:hypothetical protein
VLQFFESNGKAVARTFGFRPGSQASSSTQLYIAFILSGIIHTVGGDAMVGATYLGASFPFFFVQAVAITVEDMVIAVIGAVNLVPLYYLRLLGYLWVFWWFNLTAPLYINWSIEAGIGKSEMLPVSPVRSLISSLHIDTSHFFP